MAIDADNDYLQIYTACPDKAIHEKYILCNCGESVEFKYAPSAYVLSMISDKAIDENASATPSASCKFLEEYDEELDEEGYVCLR